MTTIANEQSPLKRCSNGDRCVHPLGCWQPATAEHFAKDRDRKDGLQSQCKACHRERSKHWYAGNVDKKREYYAGNVDKKREYYAGNVDKIRERSKRRYVENTDRMRERSKRYNAENPDKVKVYKQRRRARKCNLPDSLTAEQWQRALDYFGYRCAVCGEPESFWTVIAADHWIPLTASDCPGTVVLNIVPLCHARKGAPAGKPPCNNSKGNKPPEQWLIEQYGKRKAKQILKRIQQYFNAVESAAEKLDF